MTLKLLYFCCLYFSPQNVQLGLSGWNKCFTYASISVILFLAIYNYIIGSCHWWEYVVLRTFTAKDWIENFRVSKETFTYTFDKLKLFIQQQDTKFCKATCTEHKVAITLWYLTTCGEYCTIGHLFGIARCAECVSVHDTCSPIDVSMHHFS